MRNDPFEGMGYRSAPAVNPGLRCLKRAPRASRRSRRKSRRESRPENFDADARLSKDGCVSPYSDAWDFGLLLFLFFGPLGDAQSPLRQSAQRGADSDPNR